jgi:hypothetical protein
MRQLDWWETIRPGDLAWFPAPLADGYCPVNVSIGMTVDEAFWHYKRVNVLVIFYRPDEINA